MRTALKYYYYHSGIPDLNILSVELLSDINVAYDTAYGSLGLPSTVDVTLDDSSVVELAVTWINTYDPQVSGLQNLLGDLTLIPGIANPFLVQASINIIVAEEIFVVDLTVTGVDQTYEWLPGVEEILVEMWGGGGSGASVGTANKVYGGGGGAYASATVQRPVSGESLYSIAAAVAGTLPSGSDLDGTDGQNSYWEDGSEVLAAGGKKGEISAPGVGGAVADSVGTTVYRGGNGSPVLATSRSGAGGGGAGSTGNGGDAPNGSGSTSAPAGQGTSEFGGNGAVGSSGAGVAGAIYGGAGSGARSTGVNNVRGGNGAQGRGRLTFSGASVPPPEAGVANVYLLTGQSEMKGGNTTVNPSAHLQVALGSFIFVNSSTGFDPLEWKVNNLSSGDGFSAELPFGYEMDQLASGEIYLVKATLSGASMYLNFNVDNNSIGRTSVSTLLQGLNYLQAQGKTVNFKGVCFMQGLGDMGADNPEYANGGAAVKAAYKLQFTNWYKYLIDQLEDDGFDTSGSRLFVALTDYAYASAPLYKTEIVEAQTEVAEDFRTDNPTYAAKCSDGSVFTTADIARAADGIHFPSAGSEELGDRFKTEAAPFL